MWHGIGLERRKESGWSENATQESCPNLKNLKVRQFFSFLL